MKMKYAAILILLCSIQTLSAQTVFGKWKTIDDETNQPKSIVEIFERDGKVYGRIIKIFRRPHEDQDPICSLCDTGDVRYNKKVIGMEILKDMVRHEDEYAGGEILDPENGKVYKCKLWLDGKDLKLRGYIGFFYRTQTWVREP